MMHTKIFSDYFSQKNNFLTNIDARIKIVITIALIITIILSQSPVAPLAASIIMLSLLLAIRIPLGIILLRLAGPLGIATMVILINLFVYGRESFGHSMTIATKVLGAVSSIIFLNMTTSVNKLLSAGAWFRIPRTWVEVGMLMYRYIFVMMEDMFTIFNAQKVRLGYNGGVRSFQSMGNLAGLAVIRAFDRSLSIDQAMRLRGYEAGITVGKQGDPGCQKYVSSILEMRDVDFTYPDGTKALEGISCRVEKGEFVGILGTNGSGKTTMLKLLNGLLKATTGRISLDGEEIKSISKDILFTRVCTSFQNPDDQLFSATVGEDIAFGPSNMGMSKEEVLSRVKSALSAVGMTGSEEKVIHHLSYGQKKRICIAGVLAMGPCVMLLDEPTACMDPIASHSIMELLKNLNKTKAITMVMATHSIDLVPIFIDKVIVLDRGKIVLTGTPQEVFSQINSVRAANLRLPRIAHLFEILKKDGYDFGDLPLTIGEAREKIKRAGVTRSRG